jgi:3alpha(or 20beta)-hydroxysteroid dehydrogenase
MLKPPDGAAIGCCTRYPMNRLKNKVAIITGAARGQGEATARLFAAEGASVVLTDRLEPEVEEVARSIGNSARCLGADIADSKTWKRLTDLALAAFGRVDILVNNAAISDHHGFAELTRERLEAVLAINLIGPILGMQAVLPLMVAQGAGAIVNISSVNGLRGTAGMAGYDASKWALRGVSKSAALEYAARGIRINTVHPGAISTPMLDPDGTVDGNSLAQLLRIAAGRVGKPLEVAHASLFLASDDASYINGAELAVDGAWSAGLLVPADIDPVTRVSN